VWFCVRGTDTDRKSEGGIQPLLGYLVKRWEIGECLGAFLSSFYIFGGDVMIKKIKKYLKRIGGMIVSNAEYKKEVLQYILGKDFKGLSNPDSRIVTGIILIAAGVSVSVVGGGCIISGLIYK
jgi:hypothetical protein